MDYAVPTRPAEQLLRLFWPSSLNATALPHGDDIAWLVGWHRQSPTAPHLHTLCVATAVSCPAVQLQSALLSLSILPRLSSLWLHSNGPPILLGRFLSSTPSPDLTLPHPATAASPYFIAVTYDDDRRLPVVLSLPHSSSSPSSSSPSSSSSSSSPLLRPCHPHCQVVVFPKPNRGAFLAASPFPFRSAFAPSQPPDVPPPHQRDADSHSPLRNHTSGSPSHHTKPPAHVHPSDLDVVLRQINSCWKVEEELDAALRAHSLAPTKPSPPSPSPPPLHQRNLPSQLLAPLHSALSALAALARLMVAAAAYPLPSFLSSLSSHPVTQPRVRDLSTVASQLSFRLLSILHWPSLHRASRLPPSPSADYHASSLLLYSSVCQTVVDLLLGVLLSHLLRAHSSLLLSLVHELAHLVHSDVIRSNVGYFQQQPAGLKLNAPLNSSLAHLVLLTLDVYDAATSVIGRHEEALLTVISYTGQGLGASTLLAMASDVLSALTLHVDLLHTAFSRLYRTLLSLLSSLFLLFRGKKHNRLRHRIDSLAPSTPQLLLGVLLFAVIFFLAPTVVVYYAFFSLVRLLVMGAQAVLWWGMAACNCFPVLPLIVWIFRRGALPGGVRIEPFPLLHPPTLHPLSPMLDDPVVLEEAEAQQRLRTELMQARQGSPYTTRYHHTLQPVGWYEVRGGRRGDGGAGGVECNYLVLVSEGVSVRSLFFQYRVALSYLQRHYTARNLAAALFQGKRLPTAPPASAGLAAAAMRTDTT